MKSQAALLKAARAGHQREQAGRPAWLLQLAWLCAWVTGGEQDQQPGRGPDPTWKRRAKMTFRTWQPCLLLPIQFHVAFSVRKNSELQHTINRTQFSSARCCSTKVRHRTFKTKKIWVYVKVSKCFLNYYVQKVFTVVTSLFLVFTFKVWWSLRKKPSWPADEKHKMSDVLKCV